MQEVGRPSDIFIMVDTSLYRLPRMVFSIGVTGGAPRTPYDIVVPLVEVVSLVEIHEDWEYTVMSLRLSEILESLWFYHVLLRTRRGGEEYMY